MKTFRNLYIHLNGVDLAIFVKNLENELKAPWIRRRDKENEIPSIVINPICLEVQKGSAVVPSVLFIFQKDKETLWVSNIVPTEKAKLTYEQYNSVLENFHENVVVPAIQGTSITTNLTSDQISIGGVTGEEVEKALVDFSDLANKSTGISHPLDNKRWLEFLVLAHEASSNLDPDIITRTLVERGWPEDEAFKLGIQFEFAQDLLSYAERN